MAVFTGYPNGPVRWVPLPEPFFTQVLPHVLAGPILHVLLFAFWHLSQQEETPRYVPEEAFHHMLRWPAWQHLSPEDLRQALDRAVEAGYLLRGTYRDAENRSRHLYFLPSPRGRAAWEALQKGRWQPQDDPDRPVRIYLERPNIFRLYEENIGPLTPLIAEVLEQAAREYPASWIEEAFRLAVERNVRNWRYIEAILKRWKQEGKDESLIERDSEARLRKYLDSPFAPLYGE